LLLIAAFVSTLPLQQTFYRMALGLQVMFYTLGLLALLNLAKGPLARVCDAARVFMVLNTAALVAFLKFISGRKVAWAAPTTESTRASVQVG
jgi:hypothetical protein